MQPLPEKVTAIQALKPPRNIDELRQFLGLVGFYGKPIPFFADINSCLNKILRKGATFKWTAHWENAFKFLKPELVKLPVLQYPNPNKQFKLFTDTSTHSYSGILHQEETPDIPDSEPKLIPIAYFSGSFSKTQQLWNTAQKNIMPSIDQCKNLLSTLQAWNAHCTATINP